MGLYARPSFIKKKGFHMFLILLVDWFILILARKIYVSGHTKAAEIRLYPLSMTNLIKRTHRDLLLRTYATGVTGS